MTEQSDVNKVTNGRKYTPEGENVREQWNPASKMRRKGTAAWYAEEEEREIAQVWSMHGGSGSRCPNTIRA